MRIVTAIAVGLAAVGAMISLSNTAQAQVVIRCARQGGNCYVPNNTTVLFGRDGAVIAKHLSSTAIPCTTAAFGSDPLAYKDKICLFSFNPAAYRWTFCTIQGQTCPVVGAGMIVRYGSPITNKFVYGSFTESVPCTVEFFGDPAPGVVKGCYYTQ